MIVIKKLNASSRCVALGFFLFVSLFGAVTGYVTRPYGTQYFFAWYFMWGLGFPFLAYAVGGTRTAFWVGQFLTVVGWVWLNVFGPQISDMLPKGFDWTHVGAGLLGQVFAFIIVYGRLRIPHRGALADGGDPRDHSLPARLPNGPH